MAGFLETLEAEGRARRVELPESRPSPVARQRWVLAEEEDLYRQAFGLQTAEPAAVQAAAETVLLRFLETHALVGLADVLERYPFESSWAQRKLEEWARSGRLVAVPPAAGEDAFRWSAPENLEQVQRGSLALLRSEVTSCPPAQFADFMLRWQGLHPEARHGSAEGLAQALGRLQGIPLPAELWEQAVLPGRVPGYQPRWLDESIAAGEWAWACRAEGDSGPGLLAFWNRADLAGLPPFAGDGQAPLDTVADQVVEHLRSRGASFVADTAAGCGAAPGAVRAALWALLRRGLVTNDHFDVIRRGEAALGVDNGADPRRGAPGRRLSLAVGRRVAGRRPEGRWSLIPWGRPDPETHAVFLASVLLQRYGVVARELALLDPGMPPWRVLYEVLSRIELAGDVRRGYFVEGLSGAQFALPEAARRLAELALPATAAAPVVLVHSQDPANLYGAGAPFDIPLLDGGSRPLGRRAGNWLVLRAGRPVLVAEQQGRRITTLASAGREEVAAAVACLPAILAADRGLAARRKLAVAEWNGQPVTGTEGRELLEAAGFVRDYQEMALYARWR
jgi:ATP-dependent Lhr-like helicase